VKSVVFHLEIRRMKETLGFRSSDITDFTDFTYRARASMLTRVKIVRRPGRWPASGDARWSL
jgi:hypothetical protein